MAINWPLIRRQYEIMHSDISELANSHNVNESVISMAVKTQGWTRDRRESEQAEQEMEALSTQLARFAACQERDLVPKFILLQNKLLDKCDFLLDKVEEIEDAIYLVKLADILEKHRPAIMNNRPAEVADRGLQVKILNQFGADGACTSAIEVSQAARLSNGVEDAMDVEFEESGTDVDMARVDYCLPEA
jgi:hypothetical protein